ncbi:hypothetical protein BG006_003063, partial [Podila minutissima]
IPQLLLQLQLSRVGLTTLGVVSQNDYGKGVHSKDKFQGHLSSGGRRTVDTPNTSTNASTSTSSSSTSSSCTSTSSTSTQPPKKKQKTTQKRPPPPADEMTKAELIKAMQIKHPIRTLDIGTLKANTSQALAKEFPADADLQIKLWKGVLTCLSDISQLALKTKWLCQHMVGQYLETLSVVHLDDDDKTILSYLSTPLSVQEIAAATKDGATLATEELDTSKDDDNDSPSVGFFQLLLTAIYN